MALEIQRGKSKWFYARITVNGKKFYQNLRVRIEGTPPQSMREEGDTAFERSRLKAMVKHDELEAKLATQGNTEELYQKILEARTGERMRFLPLDQLAERWKALPRRRTLSERYESDSIAVITDFVNFLRKGYPSAKEMAAVTDTAARDFMKSEEARGISPKRYNDILKLVRSCFKRFRKEAGMAHTPFDEIPLKESDTIHRQPFTDEDIQSFVKAAAKDQEIYPLLAIAITTAMRFGDCARLNWKHIKGDFIDVKVGKTNQWVTIPIFPILKTLLDAHPGPRTGVIFPKLARRYQTAPNKILKGVRKVMESVGFGDTEKLDDDGQLKTKGAFHQHRKNGLRRASIRDIQSFRVTWVTLALNAGAPLDLVRKVTGHRTIDVVLRSYHQPGREDFRRELLSKLPNALTGYTSVVPLSMAIVRTKLLGMTSSTWETIRRELIEQLPE